MWEVAHTLPMFGCFMTSWWILGNLTFGSLVGQIGNSIEASGAHSHYNSCPTSLSVDYIFDLSSYLSDISSRPYSAPTLSSLQFRRSGKWFFVSLRTWSYDMSVLELHSQTNINTGRRSKSLTSLPDTHSMIKWKLHYFYKTHK